MRPLPRLQRAAGPPGASSGVLKREREMADGVRSGSSRDTPCYLLPVPEPPEPLCDEHVLRYPAWKRHLAQSSPSSHFQKAAGEGDLRHCSSGGSSGTGRTRDSEQVPKPLSPNWPRDQEEPKGLCVLDQAVPAWAGWTETLGKPIKTK